MIVPLVHLLLPSRSSLHFLPSQQDGISSAYCRCSSLQISQKATDTVLRLRSSTVGDLAVFREEVVTCTQPVFIIAFFLLHPEMLREILHSEQEGLNITATNKFLQNLSSHVISLFLSLFCLYVLMGEI